MDSSSDGSFAWTDASNDTIDSETKVNGNMSNCHPESESDSGKKYKKLLQRELFTKSNGVTSDEEQIHRKERKNKVSDRSDGDPYESPRKKNIKKELESDIDASMNIHEGINGHSISESYESFDESHLHSRVQTELRQLAVPSTSPSSPPVTNKREKRKNAAKSKEYSSGASELRNDTSPHLSQEEYENFHKKKKKNKKRKHSVDPDDSDPIESVTGQPPAPAPVTGARAPTMSERITFEEDETTDPATHFQTRKPSTESSTLKKFQSDSNLTPFSRKLDDESALTGDEEIWIFKCPRDVDVDAFHDGVVTLEGKCKLKLNGQTYEGVVRGESENVSILSSKRDCFEIKNVSIKGCVDLHKRIPKSHIREDATVNNPTSFIPLPDTKCRHPLFGADYKRVIRVAAHVARRLSSPRSATHATHATAVGTPKVELCLAKPEVDSERTHGKKKKNKRKLSNDEAAAPIRSKRRKRDLESAEAWESEQAIEENLFDF